MNTMNTLRKNIKLENIDNLTHLCENQPQKSTFLL